jgi:hypothetical protein
MAGAAAAQAQQGAADLHGPAAVGHDWGTGERAYPHAEPGPAGGERGVVYAGVLPESDLHAEPGVVHDGVLSEHGACASEWELSFSGGVDGEACATVVSRCRV